MAESVIHEEFSASDADVVFQSSDGVQFRLHRKNLEVVTGAFPGPEFETHDEVVELSEPADVLQVLFKFMYPTRHPDLEDLDFSLVAAVSEAAGKYEVFPAINTCITRLRHDIPNHPLEILLHGTKHDYPKLIDEAASHVIFSPAISVAEKLPPTWVLPWLRFVEESRAVIFGAARAHVKGKDCRSNCYEEYDGGLCTGCKWSLSVWIDELEKISTRSALQSAVQTCEGYSKFYPCAKCKSSKECIHIQAVAEVVKKGMNSTPQLSNFLYRNQ